MTFWLRLCIVLISEDWFHLALTTEVGKQWKVFGEFDDLSEDAAVGVASSGVEFEVAWVLEARVFARGLGLVLRLNDPVEGHVARVASRLWLIFDHA